MKIHTFTKKSKIHGKGLFANKDMVLGEFIGTYRGRSAKIDGRYILWVEDNPYYITNKFRYANHGSAPNTEVIGFEMYALRDISEGEELTLDYGEEWHE